MSVVKLLMLLLIALTCVGYADANPLVYTTDNTNDTTNFGNGVWTSPSNMLNDRMNFGATTMNNGDVMVAGGNGLVTTEIYGRLTRRWAPTASMSTRRYGLNLVTLQDNRVLAIGGYPGIASAEVYRSNSWSSVKSMGTGRAYAAAVTLKDGNVLVTGGRNSSNLRVISFATCEIYNPFTNTWTPVASMNHPRDDHTITLLPNGSVVVVAGYDAANDRFVPSSERYDPKTNTWTVIASPPWAPAAASLWSLTNNSLLLCGGSDSNGFQSRCGVFLVSENKWVDSSTQMPIALAHVGYTTLQNGSGFLAGGRVLGGNPRRTVQIWTPSGSSPPPSPPGPGSYRCMEDQCINTGAGTGVSKKECDSFCGSPEKYLCKKGRCVKSTDGTGASKEQCDSVCRS